MTATNAQLIRAYIDAEWADYKADDCTIDRIVDGRLVSVWTSF